ncbi:sigma-70 family RNA polymerase sigma factor [Plantactinospora sp. DSM 117369]
MAELVEAAQAGDEAALTELISAHLPLIYNYIGRALNGHPDVDDLVQETMILAMRGLPRLREPERFRSWLAMIAYRQVHGYVRNWQRTLRRRTELPPDLLDPGSDFVERTVTELELSGQRREVAQAARWLSDTDRNLLALWWQEATGELTRTELATALAVDIKHAGVRIQRMKAQLDAARVVVRALNAAPGCAELTTLTRSCRGRPRSVWRKRLIRHVNSCPQCGTHRNGLLPPESLLHGLALIPVATAAVVSVNSSVTPPSIWTAIYHAAANKVTAGVAGAAIFMGGGLTLAVQHSPQPQADAGVAAAPLTTAGVSTTTPPNRPPATTQAPGMTDAHIYLAPNGSDSGTGTVERPLATLRKAVTMVKPGQTIALRGGTYQPTEPVVITTSGQPTQRITLTRYRDEQPVIDASRIPADQWTITHRANYWTVQGLEIKNSGSHAYVCESCRHNIFRNLSIHDNVRSALALWRTGTVGNQVLDSDFFNNVDPADHGRSGVGLEIKFGAGEGNLIRGNRAFNNADNGFDVGDFASPITIEHNWAYGNGVNRWNITPWSSNANGFRLGGGASSPAATHQLRNNAAWDNVNHGFASSGNRGTIQLHNNTAYRNGAVGFHFPDATTVLRHNAAADNTRRPSRTVDGSTLDGNTWDSGDNTSTILQSTDPTSAQGPRTPDGKLPPTDYLRTPTGVGAAMRAP